MAQIFPEDIQDYCLQHSTPDEGIFKDLVEDTFRAMSNPEILSGPEIGNVLQMLARSVHAKRILEIGMFTGYSTLKFAEAIPEDGIVYTCEIDNELIKFASIYFARSPWGSKINILIGPALRSIKKLSGPFDIIFIDADKENYPEYYEYSVNLVRIGGLIILDNALWGGSVLNPEEESDKMIALTNEMIQKDDRVINQLVPLRDGLMIVQKLRLDK
ncbi:O-methyltransferase [Candidatus Neomarinimicrobiota bacterium]